jgi:hypothetical protein
MKNNYEFRTELVSFFKKNVRILGKNKIYIS